MSETLYELLAIGDRVANWESDRGRRPDVAYLTPELVAQFADVAVLPQSFSLIAEIASPDDNAEELFAKAKEYLMLGCQEV